MHLHPAMEEMESPETHAGTVGLAYDRPHAESKGGGGGGISYNAESTRRRQSYCFSNP